jgi:hypothetical protein
MRERMRESERVSREREKEREIERDREKERVKERDSKRQRERERNSCAKNFRDDQPDAHKHNSFMQTRAHISRALQYSTAKNQCSEVKHRAVQCSAHLRERYSEGVDCCSECLKSISS